MLWPVIVIGLAVFSPTWSAQPTNCSRNDGLGIGFGGVCKADYGSRFNIDSKELMGTTCVSRNRGINKLLTSRLRQALERMKQDFQQLQDLIDQEVSLSDSEPFGSSWRSGSLNVHRDYSKEQKTNMEKMAKFYNDPPLCSNSGEVQTDEEREQPLYNTQANFFGQPRCAFDNSSTKKLPDLVPQENRVNKGLTAVHREPFSAYDPRTAYEQQRILADIRIEPEINDQTGFGCESKNKNKFSEQELPVPSIGLNPPNFGY